MQKGRGRFIRFPALDRDEPLHEQLRRHIRELIASGAISAGTRMPAQRLLARDLRVSRNTIASAYETLISDGLLEGKPGAGTFVAESLPTSKRAKPKRVKRPSDTPSPQPLRIGAIDADLFPTTTWRRLQEARWRKTPATQLAYGDEAGWSGLRQILAQRIAATRGLSCAAEQIFVTPSTAAAVRLIASAVAEPGQCAWMEDPGFPAARAAFTSSGLRVFSGSVDDEGLDIAQCEASCPEARLAYVTPASQFPTGVVLSSARRKRLAAWARRCDSWIVEDDYESDFFFEGPAPAPLAATAPDRTIYVATLNNLLLPSMQFAFAMAPETLVDRMTAATRSAGQTANLPQHMTLYDFMDGGYFADHVRRCREVYAERRAALRHLLSAELGGAIQLARQPVGLHVLAWLPDDASDIDVATRAAMAGVTVDAISGLACEAAIRKGLLLGFAPYGKALIRSAVDRLAGLIAQA